MPDAKPVQGVKIEIRDQAGKAWIKLSTEGVPPVEISLDPQAAFDIGEALARFAHKAKFGEPANTDESYLHEQIRARVTERMRTFLTNRISVMLNTMREDKAWTNYKLAERLVETVLTKVT
jgi:hypothetical protein